MSRAGDYPADIFAEAYRLAALHSGIVPEQAGGVVDAICRAIMGERERCARVADPVDPSDTGATAYERQMFDLRIVIAERIRSGA